ncbi:hypothetical protein ACQY0O_001066 [Thecaphora frezii]
MPSFAALKQQRQARRTPRFGAAQAAPGPVVSDRPDTDDSVDKSTIPSSRTSQPPRSPSPPPSAGPTSGDGHVSAHSQPQPQPASQREIQQPLPAAEAHHLAENADLVIRHAEGKGRGVFWQPQPTQPSIRRRGEVLLQLRPTTSVLSSSLLATRCSHCFRAAADVDNPMAPQQDTSSGGSLQRCSACKAVRYCDIACQRSDWPQHKDECKALRSYARLRAEARAKRKLRGREPSSDDDGENDGMQIEGDDDDGDDEGRRESRLATESDTVPGTTIRALARLLWAVGRKGNEDLRRRFDELQSHKSRMSQEALQPLAEVSVQLAHYLGASRAASLSQLADAQQAALRDLGLGSASHLLDAVCKFTCNSFSLTDSDLSAIGTCLHPTAALFNHSCWPNAVVVFPFAGKMDGGPMHVVAIRNIEPGEEVQISYVDPSNRYDDRQRTLGERYHFSCGCPLCVRTRKQRQSQATGGGGGAPKTTKWRDPREAMWCPQRCGGWIARPSATGGAATAVCNKCKRAAQLDPTTLSDDVRRGKEAIAEAEALMAKGEAAMAWQRCAELLGPMAERYPPSSQPLFDLLRVSQTALIELGSASLSAVAAASTNRQVAGRSGTAEGEGEATRYFFQEATRLAMLVAAGCQASTLGAASEGGSIYAEGHPARAVALATLGKLVLVELQRPMDEDGSGAEATRGAVRRRRSTAPSSSSSVLRHPPSVPEEARLAFAREVLRQALEELEVGFGRRNGGGATGRDVRRALEELEHEEALVAQALKATA